MKDYFNQELKINDFVVYISERNKLNLSEISNIFKDNVELSREITVNPKNLIKITPTKNVGFHADIAGNYLHENDWFIRSLDFKFEIFRVNMLCRTNTIKYNNSYVPCWNVLNVTNFIKKYPEKFL